MDELRSKLDRIARVLSNYCKNNGLSQRDLAEKLEKEVSYVNKVLQGEANLTLRTIVEFEMKLGIDLLKPPMWYEPRPNQSNSTETGQLTGLSLSTY